MKNIVTLSAIVLFLIVAGTKGTEAQVGTPEQEMLKAIRPICIDLSNAGPLNAAEQDLFDSCSNVLGGGGDANSQLNAAGQLTSEETNVMERVTVDITGAQVSSTLRRTAVLRGRATYRLCPAFPKEITSVKTDQRWEAVLPRDCQPGGNCCACHPAPLSALVTRVVSACITECSMSRDSRR